MGNPYPVHTCTVGPFDSYHSNVVNRISGLVSNYEDCIFSADPIDVTQFSESELTISAGSVFKDDVLVKIEEITIDFSDPDYYAYGSAWDGIGYFYVMLYYVYAKTRPAPKPSIQILKPDERDSFVPGPNSAWIFLKCARVELVGFDLEITALYDYDPDDTSIKRIYSKPYIGIEDSQPIFSFSRDNGRLVLTGDTLYYGGLTDWITIPTETEVNNLRTFVGADSAVDTTPDYTSIRHIVQNSPLETAISTLDLSMGLSDLVRTASDNSATPSILSGGKICGLIRLANTNPTSVTDFADAPTGVGANEAVMISVMFVNSNTTIVHNPAAISLQGEMNLKGLTGQIIILINYSGVWYEVSRSGSGGTITFCVPGYPQIGTYSVTPYFVVPASYTAKAGIARLFAVPNGQALQGKISRYRGASWVDIWSFSIAAGDYSDSTLAPSNTDLLAGDLIALSITQLDNVVRTAYNLTVELIVQ